MSNTDRGHFPPCPRTSPSSASACSTARTTSSRCAGLSLRHDHQRSFGAHGDPHCCAAQTGPECSWYNVMPRPRDTRRAFTGGQELASRRRAPPPAQTCGSHSAVERREPRVARVSSITPERPRRVCEAGPALVRCACYHPCPGPAAPPATSAPCGLVSAAIRASSGLDLDCGDAPPPAPPSRGHQPLTLPGRPETGAHTERSWGEELGLLEFRGFVDFPKMRKICQVIGASYAL